MPRPQAARADRSEVQAIALGEMVDIAARSRGALVREAAKVALRVPARALARSLVALDRDLARTSLRRAAMRSLSHYGVRVLVGGPGLRPSPVDVATAPVPARGPLLVIANHPGLFDALALFAAIAREDLRIVAAERPLFRALPHVRSRLLSVEDEAETHATDARTHSAIAVRRAVRHLEAGGAILHFPAGRIEPDPRVARPGEPMVLSWRAGVDTLVRAAARARPDLVVVPMAVSGVISRRARAIAHAIGRTDTATGAIVPLIQLTFPGFGDVDTRVHTGALVRGAELVAAGTRPSDVLRPRLEELVRRAAGPT
jgi:putative hemolysin